MAVVALRSGLEDNLNRAACGIEVDDIVEKVVRVDGLFQSVLSATLRPMSAKILMHSQVDSGRVFGLTTYGRLDNIIHDNLDIR